LSARAVDLFEAKFPSNSFDGVVGFHLIEHIADPLAFMREVHRITKPGGIILFGTPREGGYLQRLMGRHWLNYRHQEHLYFFSRETMTVLLEKAGFRHIHCFGDETRWYPVHFLLRGATYFFDNPVLQKAFGLAERVFRLSPFSYLQVPFPLDILLVTAQK
jgi:SAM-dependent methyltransferase